MATAVIAGSHKIPAQVFGVLVQFHEFPFVDIDRDFHKVNDYYLIGAQLQEALAARHDIQSFACQTAD
jgi:hypothetical protein